MSSPFSNLSHNLILQIADLLWEAEDVRDAWPLITKPTLSFGEHAVYNLSRTSTSLYKLLTPYTFRSITLRNTKKSGRALQYLPSTSQAASIEILLFKCKIPGGKEEDNPSIEKVFPTEVDDVLSNLSRFPRLATLIIDLRLVSHCVNIYYDDDLEMVGEKKKRREDQDGRGAETLQGDGREDLGSHLSNMLRRCSGIRPETVSDQDQFSFQ